MRFQDLPNDILNKIAELLEYRLCVIYFRLSKRFLLLNTDRFWKDKMQTEFNERYWKTFYDRQICNYMASRYVLLRNTTSPGLVSIRIKKAYLKAKLKDKEDARLQKYKEEEKAMIDNKNKELNMLCNFLINYLKFKYPNIFKVIYANNIVYNKLNKNQYEKYKEGIQSNLILNTDGSTAQTGFFINNEQIHFMDFKASLFRKFPSSFHTFIEELGLEEKDVHKLYNISENINHNINEFKTIIIDENHNTSPYKVVCDGHLPIHQGKIVNKSSEKFSRKASEYERIIRVEYKEHK